jgi:RNA polymerase sigma-70 factor (ECF subfamily)
MQTESSKSNRHPLPDMDLVHSAKRGDIAAFEELVRRHTRRVFAVAQHITRSREDAEEVSQETFLRAFLRLRDFEEKAQFSTWLTRIARCTRDKVVSCEEHEWEGASIPEPVPDWRPNPEQLYSQSQLREILRQALEALPQTYSTVFILRDIQGFSMEETAAVLELSVPTIKTRLFRARLQLRDSLSKFFISTLPSAGGARSNLVARVRPLVPECGSTVARRKSDPGCKE